MVVVAGAGLLVRDLVLWSRGGGVTPRSLLLVEIAALGATVVAGGLVVSRSGDDDRAERIVAIAAATAATVHAIRLVTYLSARNAQDGGRRV
jgi:hypothetical protein